MKETKNYNLKKPERTDFFNIDDFNYNADIIEEELEKRASKELATITSAGLMSASDKSKLNDIDAQANKVIGVKGSLENEYRTGNVNLSAENIGATPVAHLRSTGADQHGLGDGANAGFSTNDYTMAEKTKLSGIEACAQVNAVTSVNDKTGAVVLSAEDVGAATIEALSVAVEHISNISDRVEAVNDDSDYKIDRLCESIDKKQDLIFAAGFEYLLTAPDNEGEQPGNVHISGFATKDTATASKNGLMSAEDKAKLDKIQYIYRTEIITANKYWVVPNYEKSKGVTVRLFGGGGGGKSAINGAGGGGGHMAVGVFYPAVGDIVNVTIGIGGIAGLASGENGGVSSFGTYISASGGNGGEASGRGGFGGTGGGGSGGYGGRGSYGGGGGGSSASDGSGGNGGTYGGGGGGAGKYLSTFTTTGGAGGTYGGNGGSGGYLSDGSAGVNGVNTLTLDGVEFRGEGLGGLFGAIGVSSGGGGGGGGYGGNGGNGAAGWAVSAAYGQGGGGGGGGYGGNGGAGTYGAGGGGGGYGGNGKSSGDGGGGGGYGPDNYGAGGNGGINLKTTQNGSDGVCIIQYYESV
ncbi:MAG: hypothetical protein LBR74_09455 [Eubacterium sp.]|jgi:hypothetical protein|nr:hypothetical protein [Eubacterium sp.]